MKNSRTSQGALRKNWVTAQDTERRGVAGLISPSPRNAPNTVPMAMDRKLMRMFIPKPRNSSGVQRARMASTLA